MVQQNQLWQSWQFLLHVNPHPILLLQSEEKKRREFSGVTPFLRGRILHVLSNGTIVFFDFNNVLIQRCILLYRIIISPAQICVSPRFCFFAKTHKIEYENSFFHFYHILSCKYLTEELFIVICCFLLLCGF